LEYPTGSQTLIKAHIRRKHYFKKLKAACGTIIRLSGILKILSICLR
jgi:hypothetical protein